MEDEFAININREKLASISGTAKESLISTLSDFRNEKIIHIKKMEVLLLSIQKN